MTQLYQSDVKDTAFAVFFEEAVENPSKSKEAGHPVFEPKVYVEILTPGSKDIFRQPADERHFKRFADQYQKFLNKQKQVPDGVPIDELSTATAVERATCKALNVFTVEALASYPDGSVHRLGPGAHALKRKASAFLESRKGASFATALQNENVTLREKIASLETKMTELLARLPKDGEH